MCLDRANLAKVTIVWFHTSQHNIIMFECSSNYKAPWILNTKAYMVLHVYIRYCVHIPVEAREKTNVKVPPQIHSFILELEGIINNTMIYYHDTTKTSKGRPCISNTNMHLKKHIPINTIRVQTLTRILYTLLPIPYGYRSKDEIIISNCCHWLPRHR